MPHGEFAMNTFIESRSHPRLLSSSVLCPLLAALLLAGCASAGDYLANRIDQSAEERAIEEAGGAPESALTPPDFEPGERTLFSEDFSTTEVGSVPRSLGSTRGGMEVIEWQGQRLLRISSDAQFTVTLPETLPQEFTLAVDYFATESRGNPLEITPVTKEDVRSIKIMGMKGENIAEGGTDPLPSLRPEGEVHPRPVRVTTEDGRVKVHIGQRNVVSISDANFKRTRALRFVAEPNEGEPVYIGNIRIAAMR